MVSGGQTGGFLVYLPGKHPYNGATELFAVLSPSVFVFTAPLPWESFTTALPRMKGRH